MSNAYRDALAETVQALSRAYVRNDPEMMGRVIAAAQRRLEAIDKSEQRERDCSGCRDSACDRHCKLGVLPDWMSAVGFPSSAIAEQLEEGGTQRQTC